MKKCISFIITSLVSVIFSPIWGQITEPQKEKAAQFLNTNAKYHTVIAVLVVIFIGFISYGIYLHHKLNKLENNQK